MINIIKTFQLLNIGEIQCLIKKVIKHNKFEKCKQEGIRGWKREELTSSVPHFRLWHIWKTYFSHISINVSKDKMYTWSRARMFAIRVQIIFLNCANMGDSVEVTGSNCSRRETTKTCNFCLSWTIVLYRFNYFFYRLTF